MRNSFCALEILPLRLGFNGNFIYWSLGLLLNRKLKHQAEGSQNNCLDRNMVYTIYANVLNFIHHLSFSK